MKFSYALFALSTLFTADAFAPKAPVSKPLFALRSSLEEAPKAASDVPIVPLDLPMTRIEGGGTLRTYDVPDGAERVEVHLKTNGRPLNAFIELWEGPVRLVHSMYVDVQDGDINPYRCVLSNNGKPKTLKISGKATYEFPLDVGVSVPEGKRQDEIKGFGLRTFDNNEKHFIQGSSTMGGVGAVRSFPIDPSIDAIQVMLWSANCGKRAIKAKFELLRGPNNMKQSYELMCQGDHQPYHAVFETPGGVEWTLRIYNTNELEFPVEAVVLPYDASKLKSSGPAPRPKKEWWE